MPSAKWDPKASLEKFKQQQLSTWQPILMPKPVIGTFFGFGVVFIIIGAVLLASSRTVQVFDQRYDDICEDKYACNVTLELKEFKYEKGTGLYFYYQLENFFQNHRRYVKSRNDDQLRGVKVEYADTADCDPLRAWPDANGDASTDESDLLSPCGLVAWSQFNDSFTLYDPEGEIVPWQKTGITWAGDQEVKYKNPSAEANEDVVRVVADFQDEDFIVWMRTSGLPKFRKLYRRINQNLAEGSYTLEIKNRFPVSAFKGTKSIVISTSSWVGGRNDFLGIAYLVVGCICFVQAVLFLGKHLHSPRELGDKQFLEYTKSPANSPSPSGTRKGAH